MHQDIQAGPLGRGNGNHRDVTQHFRKAVHVNLHSPFLYDIHHVKGKDDRLAQFQQLKRQVKVTFQTGCIHYIYNDFDIIIQDTFPCYFFLYGIRGQGVNAGGIHQLQSIAFILQRAFVFFHSDAGPVGHLKLGTRYRIKQRCLSAVGISHKRHMYMVISLHPLPPPLLRFRR